MKKVLLASTALVATSGFAMAQGVELSGYAEMGIYDNGVTDTQFHSDIDVKFSLSGETDNGLTFGATIDLDEVGGGISNRGNPASVFISGAFGTVTMGDTDGAFDFALSEVDALTTLTDDHTSHGGFTGNGGLDGTNDGQILRYDHAVGDLAFAVSAELDDTSGGTGDGDVYAIGARWSGDLGGTSLAIGVGYQENDFTDLTGVSVRVGFGDVEATVNYVDVSTGGDYTAIGVTYTSGPLGLHANYGEFDGGSDGFGLAMNYDLGGGAVAMIGYTDNGVDDITGALTGESHWSAGFGLSF